MEFAHYYNTVDLNWVVGIAIKDGKIKKPLEPEAASAAADAVPPVQPLGSLCCDSGTAYSARTSARQHMRAAQRSHQLQGAWL